MCDCVYSRIRFVYGRIFRFVLECAPVPVTRDTLGNVGDLGHSRRARRTDAASDGHDGAGGCRGGPPVGGIAANLVGTGTAALVCCCRRRGVVGGGGRCRAGQVAAVGACPPGLELPEAVGAGAVRRAPRVVVGLLVERDLKGRVEVAEDVATAAAVVATREVVERLLACRFVAHC